MSNHPRKKRATVKNSTSLQMSAQSVNLSANLRKLPESGKMGIDVLNDYCLINIIKYLPIVDRVRIEGVSKRWKLISLKSWCHFKKLDFNNNTWGFSKSKSIKNMELEVIKKILRRCGPFLTSISFSESNKFNVFGTDILSSVAKLCPQLEYLDAEDLEASSWELRDLCQNCTKLVSVMLDFCDDNDFPTSCEYLYSLLFKRNKNLKSVEIDACDCRFTGKCLKKLNKCIESIVIFYANGLKHEHFKVVKSFHQLKRLGLFSIQFNNDTMKDVSSLETLEYLNLRDFIVNGNANFTEEISKLKNLKILELTASKAVNDQVLESIATNCILLQHVNIGDCISVTNEGLASIITLPNLEVLNISYNKINDQVFSNTTISTLRRLTCCDCIEMKDAGLISLIEVSENMEYLNVCGCKKISNKLLEAAIRITAKRKSQVILMLYVICTGVQKDLINNTSPFLHIIYTPEFEE